MHYAAVHRRNEMLSELYNAPIALSQNYSNSSSVTFPELRQMQPGHFPTRDVLSRKRLPLEYSDAHASTFSISAG